MRVPNSYIENTTSVLTSALISIFLTSLTLGEEGSQQFLVSRSFKVSVGFGIAL